MRVGRNRVSLRPTRPRCQRLGTTSERPNRSRFSYADSGGDGNESSSSNLLVERPDTRPFGTQLYWRRHDEVSILRRKRCVSRCSGTSHHNGFPFNMNPDHPDHPVHVPIKLASGDDEEGQRWRV